MAWTKKTVALLGCSFAVLNIILLHFYLAPPSSKQPGSSPTQERLLYFYKNANLFNRLSPLVEDSASTILNVPTHNQDAQPTPQEHNELPPDPPLVPLDPKRNSPDNVPLHQSHLLTAVTNVPSQRGHDEQEHVHHDSSNNNNKNNNNQAEAPPVITPAEHKHETPQGKIPDPPEPFDGNGKDKVNDVNVIVFVLELL